MYKFTQFKDIYYKRHNVNYDYDAYVHITFCLHAKMKGKYFCAVVKERKSSLVGWQFYFEICVRSVALSVVPSNLIEISGYKTFHIAGAT